MKNHQCTTIIKAKSDIFSFFVDEKSILWSKHSKNTFLVVLDPSKLFLYHFGPFLTKKHKKIFGPNLMRFFSGDPYELNKKIKIW